MNHGKTRIILLFLALPLTLYAVLVVSPYAQAFQISLTSWSGFTADKPFVGFDNFQRLLQDPEFWRALAHNGLLLVVVPLVTIALGLFFAAMLNVGGSGGKVAGVRGSAFYSRVYFLPHILPVVITAVLWQFIYNPQIGLLNGGLEAIGLGGLAHSWLGDPTVALWALIGVLVWAGVGFYVVLFSAAMQSIPKDIFEAAELDGAGRFQTLTRITLPLLRETVQVAWIYLGIHALDAFALFMVLAPSGGPDNSTMVLSQYLYLSAFQKGNFGYATAIGVLLSLLSLLMTALTFGTSRKKTTIEF
ncbi:sugar ABC transporter permease [Streptomyces sp. RLB1-33]|uniref:carbohydrate ABC transporter permease n=1 Tax=Streptomyces mirabilis TaxID=68239 RepID=UPI00143E6E7B|nr:MULTISPECIES: sugar ABC transporter permease [Streptomyces]QIY69092.1 sugar ABC transporter permease [Streptomyces sp. RLB1-33]QUW84138.1 sugar ABC transporter permease [Streptomyces mirabilis]